MRLEYEPALQRRTITWRAVSRIPPACDALRKRRSTNRTARQAGKSGHVGTERDTFLRQKPKPELGAPPEYVVGILRPFVLDQVIDLAGGEASAKVLAEVLAPAGLAEDVSGMRAVGAEEPAHRPLLEKRIIMGEGAHARSDFVMIEIAAGQRRRGCPWRAHCREEALQLFQSVFGEAAIGGDLAAEHRHDRCGTRRGIELENVVAGRLGSLRGAVIIKRTNAGIGPA